MQQRSSLRGTIALLLISIFSFSSFAFAQTDCSTLTFPTISGTIHQDLATRQTYANDFGGSVSQVPCTVAKPASNSDVQALISFARQHAIPVAVRGAGHVDNGQSQVNGGLVIDMKNMNQVLSMTPTYADVQAGMLWSALVVQTNTSFQATPKVLTTELGTTIGGTLSVGGIGPFAARHGFQIDNVIDIDVVDGRGLLFTCSPTQNQALFYSVLGGMGQYGIITRAKISLQPSPQYVRQYYFAYLDIQTLISDVMMAANDGRFTGVQGLALPNQLGGFVYLMQAFQQHSDIVGTTLGDPARFSGLHNVGAPVIQDTTWYPDFTNDTGFKDRMVLTGEWAKPHPWAGFFLPENQITTFIQTNFSQINSADFGINGGILLLPGKRVQNHPTIFETPEIANGSRFLLVGLLYNASDATRAAQLQALNQTMLANVLNLGGKAYPFGTMPQGSTQWTQQFGTNLNTAKTRKQIHDPDNIFNPGLGIFNGL
ncbi:MAG: FAD-binding protein [Bdellovibrionota bacterium]